MTFSITGLVNVKIALRDRRDINFDITANGATFGEIRQGVDEFVRDFITFNDLGDDNGTVTLTYFDDNGTVEQSLKDLLNKVL